MKAVGSYIIIIPEKEVQVKTKGGLILNSKDKEDFRYKKALVKNIGPDVVGVKNGDNIYYDKVAGDLLEINEKEYVVIKNTDIVVVI